MTDCLLIGHNDMSFTDYAEGLYAFGKDSPAYRDLKLNFIWHKGKRHTVTDILNLYSQKNVQFSIGDVFSTTIAYLGTYLNKHGFSFDYINDYQSQKEEFKDKLLSKDIFAIGITSTLYTHLTPIEEICKFIRRYNKDVRIIVGGPFILNSFFASSNERALHVLLKRLKVDVLVNSSQGETTLVRVLQAMKSGNCLGDIPRK